VIAGCPSGIWTPIRACGRASGQRYGVDVLPFLLLSAGSEVIVLCGVQGHVTSTAWVASPIGAKKPTVELSIRNPMTVHRDPTSAESPDDRRNRIKLMAQKRAELGNSQTFSAVPTQSRTATPRSAPPPPPTRSVQSREKVLDDDLIQDLEAGMSQEDGTQRFRGSINPSKPMGW
jgi:hypothetical protein